MRSALRLVLALSAVAACASAPPRSDAPRDPARAEPIAQVGAVPVMTPVVAGSREVSPQPPVGAPPGNMTGGKEHAMSNCPNAVAGARTSMIFTDDGIVLAISAASPTAQKEIRRRAHLHAQLSAPSGRGLHTGGHGGPGRVGYCPIIHDGRTVVTAADTRTGATIRMRADGNDDAVAELQELVALRVSGLPPVMPPDLPIQADR